jgi:Tfp pilus assembly protein PilP
MITLGRFPVLIAIACTTLLAGQTFCAEEAIHTPSEKMKEAVGELNKVPANIGKSLENLTEAAKTKLQEAFGGESKPVDKNKQLNLDVQRKDLTAPPAPRSGLTETARDPFRPMTLRTKVQARVRENLSPLERFDLSQLKLVGIIWDIKEPRALVEDSTGLGYVVKVGTPIGNNDGKIKTIRRGEIVIEEIYPDAYGKATKRDVGMKISTE